MTTSRAAGWVVLGALGALGGCSLQRMALDQTASLIKAGMPAFERESDYDLAVAALPANIKMIESFLQSGQDSQELLQLAAQIYYSYALVALEDEVERLEEDTPPSERARRRAIEMYRRAHRYGLRLLQQRHEGFKAAFKAGHDALAAALAACEADDAPALLWAGLPLAGAIDLGRDDVRLIGMQAKAKALIARSVELNERYFNAVGHVVLGSMSGAVGKMLGGDAKRSRRHFERALQLTGRKLLLVQVMYARTLAVQLQDRKLFESLLGEVLQAKLEIYPEQQLPNVVAKRKARRLLARADELF